MRLCFSFLGCAVLSGCLIDIDLGLLDGGPGPARDGAIAGDAGMSGCPEGMLELSGLCVGSTEITNAAYARFLAANVSTQGQIARCRANASWTPSMWPPSSGREAHPVVGIDWCDAAAYCAWTGARLCTPAEWMTACMDAYPYGSSYEAARCNGEQGSDTAPTGSFAGCARAGIFDLSGNVEEWIDACADGPGQGQNDLCVARGGAFGSGAAALACAAETSSKRSDGDVRRGARCCR